MHVRQKVGLTHRALIWSTIVRGLMSTCCSTRWSIILRLLLLLQLSGEAAWLEKYRAAAEDSHTVTFELYLAMQELSNLTEHVKDERCVCVHACVCMWGLCPALCTYIHVHVTSIFLHEDFRFLIQDSTLISPNFLSQVALACGYAVACVCVFHVSFLLFLFYVFTYSAMLYVHCTWLSYTLY